MSRHTNRSTVESSLSASVRDFLRVARIHSGEDCSGTMTRRRQPGGNVVGTIGFRIAASDPGSAHVRLRYTSDSVPVDDTIQLERTPCRFGGWR